MPPARERHAQKEGGLINEFLLLLFARPARDRPHHPRARCARADPPHASFRPRESCLRRFEGPRLVSAHAQILRTKVIEVEGSGSLRELSDQ